MDQIESNLPQTSFLKKDGGDLLPFFPKNSNNNNYIEAEKVEIKELELPTDQLDTIHRRVLIGIQAYGLHDSRLASFCGLLPAQLKKIIDSKEIQDALKSGITPCWTKAELISRLCVEAETAKEAKTRILAITKLMEYRSITSPEGGARSFTRVIGRFGRSGRPSGT